MASPNRPARLNRTLLALIGTVLLAAGAFGAAFGLGALRGPLPGLDPTVPLLPQQLDPPSWLPYAVVAACVVLGLANLRWLLAQTRRRPRTGTWNLPTTGDVEGTTSLDSDHAARALTHDIESYDQVRSASSAIVGDHRRPHVHLQVTAESGADLTALRNRIAGHALTRLRQAHRDACPDTPARREKAMTDERYDGRPSRPEHDRAPAIADAVLACPGVVDLHGGPSGTVATYLPGRRVTGVRLDDGPAGTDVAVHVAVHVVGCHPHSIVEISTQVRAATRRVVPGADVAVTVEDYRW